MGSPPRWGRLSLLFGDQIVKQGDDRKYVRPPTQARVLWASSRVHNVSGGGGGVLQKWYTGRLHPEVRPLNYPFIYRFWQKSSPFRIPSIDKWYPFHTPSIELCIPFNNCTCIVFNISWINHKTRTFSQLFHCIKMHLLALLSLFTDEMAYFPTHSYTSTSEIHNISFTWRLKKVTLWGVASPYRPL